LKSNRTFQTKKSMKLLIHGRKFTLITSLVLFANFHFTFAQNPVPGSAQTKRILLMNGRVHIGNGNIIENGAVGFANGVFDLVADATTIRIDRTAYDTIIDVSGREVYPGLIAMNTVLGLNEIEAVRATNDVAETGMLNPSVRSIIAYNTDSKVIPTVRSNGVLMAQIVPKPSGSSPALSGQSSVVVLDAWNYEDAAYATDNGLHLHWPNMRIYRTDEPGGEEKQRIAAERNINELKKLFTEAKAYSNEPKHTEKNIHLESMKGLFNGKKKLYIHCNNTKEIIAAVSFSKEFGVNIVLVGAREALAVSNLLKENAIPVVVVETHRLPSTSDEPIDYPYEFPYLLKKAGIPFAISVPEFWQVRNLAYQAGTGAAYGLSKEEALESITLSPARIMGIDKTTGSIEVGKDATLIVCKGDVLDMRTSEVLRAYIEGRNIDVDNIQSQLNRKFRSKYQLPVR
jgi:imidazolonepropionase-like amidohydrolase